MKSIITATIMTLSAFGSIANAESDIDCTYNDASKETFEIEYIEEGHILIDNKYKVFFKYSEEAHPDTADIYRN